MGYQSVNHPSADGGDAEKIMQQFASGGAKSLVKSWDDLMMSVIIGKSAALAKAS